MNKIIQGRNYRTIVISQYGRDLELYEIPVRYSLPHPLWWTDLQLAGDGDGNLYIIADRKALAESKFFKTIVSGNNEGYILDILSKLLREQTPYDSLFTTDASLWGHMSEAPMITFGELTYYYNEHQIYSFIKALGEFGYVKFTRLV